MQQLLMTSAAVEPNLRKSLMSLGKNEIDRGREGEERKMKTAKRRVTKEMKRERKKVLCLLD